MNEHLILKNLFIEMGPYLLEREEYGGYIHTESGKIKLKRGKQGVYTIDSLIKVRQKTKQQWTIFHTHPIYDIPEPSSQDCIITSAIGSPTYILTRKGIYKVIPLRKFTKKELKQTYQTFFDELGDDYSEFNLDKVTPKHFPCDIKLFTKYDTTSHS